MAGTVTVTGAPSGFSPAYLGAGACPATTPPAQVCADPLYALSTNGSYSLQLPAGVWRIIGFYEINPFGGAFLGSPQTVTVGGSGVVTVNLKVPYKGPAAIRGTVRITGLPTGATLQQVSVLLCPYFAPYSGGFTSITCVTGYATELVPGAASGRFEVTGLPPGRWIAYPSYCTQFGCATNAKAGKSVELVSGRTDVVNLSTPFLVPPNGLLTGSLTLTGAPPGYSPPLGVSACQSQGGTCLSLPVYVGANTYETFLSDGSWTVQGFYLAPPFYNTILGPKQQVTIVGGQVTRVNLSIPYQVPGTVEGAVHVTGVPRGVAIRAYTVLACPAASPWSGGSPPIGCVSEYSGTGGAFFGIANSSRISAVTHPPAASLRRPGGGITRYALPTLTAGDWLLYPGYQTIFGTFTDHVGTKVTVVPGKTVERRLTTPYQVPGVGAIVGKVQVVGAPANNFEAGARACATSNMAFCVNEHDAFVDSLGGYQMPLPPGTWWVSGFVDVFAVFNGPNTTLTPPSQVKVTAGSQARENFIVTVG